MPKTNTTEEYDFFSYEESQEDAEGAGSSSAKTVGDQNLQSLTAKRSKVLFGDVGRG
jgi:hypothetical protein